jgi:hypothetical protein
MSALAPASASSEQRGEYRLRTFFSTPVGRGFVSLDPPRSERAFLLSFVARLRRDPTWFLQSNLASAAPSAQVSFTIASASCSSRDADLLRVLRRVRPLALRCADRLEFRRQLSSLAEGAPLCKAFAEFEAEMRTRSERVQQHATSTSSPFGASSSRSSSTTYEQVKQSALQMFASASPQSSLLASSTADITPATVLSWPPLIYSRRATNTGTAFSAQQKSAHLLALHRLKTPISAQARATAKRCILVLVCCFFVHARLGGGGGGSVLFFFP